MRREGVVLDVITDPKCDERVLLQKNPKELCQQGESSRVIRFHVDGRVLVLEIVRIASEGSVQPSDSILRR